MIGYYSTAGDVGVFSFGLIGLTGMQRYTASINTYYYRKVLRTQGTESRDSSYYKKLFSLPYAFNLFVNSGFHGVLTLK